MTRRDWWLGVVLIVVAVLLHAAIPRYTWQWQYQDTPWPVRIDRWTGQADLMRLYQGRFYTHTSLRPPTTP